MLSNLLKSGTVSPFISETFPIIRIILVVAILLSSIAIIVICMMLNSSNEGENAITGQTESFYMSNKSTTKQGRLQKAVTILAISIAVLTVLYLLSYVIYPAGM